MQKTTASPNAFLVAQEVNLTARGRSALLATRANLPMELPQGRVSTVLLVSTQKAPGRLNATTALVANLPTKAAGRLAPTAQRGRLRRVRRNARNASRESTQTAHLVRRLVSTARKERLLISKVLLFSAHTARKTLSKVK